MRKTYPLIVQGKHRDRVLDAVKHDIRKYLKRERRRELPEGMDFWDFDCKAGLSKESAVATHVAALVAGVDALAREDAASVYVEVLARPAKRAPRLAVADPTEGESAAPAAPAVSPA